MPQPPALKQDAQQPWTATRWPDVLLASPCAAPWEYAFTLARPLCTCLFGGAPSPAGASWDSSLLGISHFLGQSFGKQMEKARAKSNTEIAKDTLHNCRGEKYRVSSLCRGGVFTHSQQQRWHRSCVINKSSALLLGPASKGWSLTPALNWLESSWKQTEIKETNSKNEYICIFKEESHVKSFLIFITAEKQQTNYWD